MPLNLPPPKAACGPSPNSLPISHHPAFSTYDAEATTNLPPVSSTSKLGIPPPKTKAKLATAGQAKKFFLDLPQASSHTNKNDDQPDGQPAAKKARTGGSGLGALLPEPKRQVQVPDDARNPTSRQNSNEAPSLLPHILKGKAKGTEITAKQDSLSESQAAASASQPMDVPQDDQPSAEVLDFFGLSSVPAASEPAIDFFSIGASNKGKQLPGKAKPPLAAPSRNYSDTTMAPQTATPRISAAPAPAAPSLESNYYATLPLPTPRDPYPGFFQKPDGSWAARRPEEWAIWAAAHAPTEALEDEAPAEPVLPADFDETARTNSIEIRAAALRANGGAVDTRPSKVTDEDKKKAEEAKEQQKSQKKFTHVARSRHQLGTLIADAVNNRAELEDRIAQMKANKRTGGSKYGF